MSNKNRDEEDDEIVRKECTTIETEDDRVIVPIQKIKNGPWQIRKRNKEWVNYAVDEASLLDVKHMINEEFSVEWGGDPSKLLKE